MNLSFVWDYDLNESQFLSLLDGKEKIGRLDSDWAAIRLLEYATYPEIVKFLGYKRLIQGWPNWRKHIRSASRLRSFDFLTIWLKDHPSEWDK